MQPYPRPARVGAAARPRSAAPRRGGAILHTSGTSGVPKAVPYRQDRLAARVRVTLGPARTRSGLRVRVGVAAPSHRRPRDAVRRPRLRRRGCYARRFQRRELASTLAAVVSRTRCSYRRRSTSCSSRTRSPLPPPHAAVRRVPIHPDTLRARRWPRCPASVVNIYGQTEGSPITCLTADDHLLAAGGRPELLRSVGPGRTRCRAAHRGRRRRRCRRGDRPSGALVRADPDGWLRTGDLGPTRRRRLPLPVRAARRQDHPRRGEHLPRRGRGGAGHPPRGA